MLQLHQYRSFEVIHQLLIKFHKSVVIRRRNIQTRNAEGKYLCDESCLGCL